MTSKPSKNVPKTARRATPKGKAPPSKALAKPYEPTPRERSAMEALIARREERKPAPSLKVTERKGGPEVGADHPDPGLGQALIMEALGLADIDFFGGLLRQLGNAAGKGGVVDEQNVNFMLAVVKGVEPQDQVETMLAAQMAAVHMATMTFARRLNHVESIAQQDSAANAFNKLARTFSAQMEALKRYRTGGEQKATVTHVTVNEGGQAVVGHITARGRGAAGNQEPTS